LGELALRLASLPLAPLAHAQGRRVRASLPPPRPAAGEPFGRAEPTTPWSRDALRLLVVGESTVAGCGIGHQRDAMAAHVAAALAAREHAPVEWRAVGLIGITARRVVRELEDQVAADGPADLAVIALGVNDVLQQTSARAFAGDLASVIAMVRRRQGPVPIVMAGVPPVGSFPVLPQPLRALLGWRARRLDRAAARLAALIDRVAYVPMRVDRGARALFADDGFHPSSEGCRVWAAALVAAAQLGPDRVDGDST
jgi:lysophospholipase L1-like esterase